ncbi:MAG: PhnD/SsuA/transferrin family substrate-binding protein [Rhodovibrionaceae bacterium]
MSLASLPMYSLSEVRPAAEAWWRGLAKACRAEGLGAVPESLNWPEDPKTDWRSGDLFLSQTCGYPLMTELQDSVRVIATPCYTAEGCAGPFYSSVLLVRADQAAETLSDLRGCRAAYNSQDSQSGYNVLRSLVAPLAGGRAFFAAVLETGSHAGSIAAVAEGRADLAAVDCVTFALHRKHRPQAVANLRVLFYGPATPGLPYITAGGRGEDDLLRLREALYEALADPRLAEAREALLLSGAAVLPGDAYRVLLDMRRDAAAQGYETLR